ncbi:hypothetical protein DU19_1014 [Chlamydia muridarum]|nr:hypothetical protein DU17_1015 [Chlamydia muridarum]KDU81953.1 hypothetical protein DU18_1014 [Chlamydia muridarum]KDU82595.1 hypothetical protein DU19_1014 [Chlamydia muridarum]KDU83907.1 hypothetical protein DU20_1013 [Chlamydia muridarum]KDU84009.1 hypothetical protein DU21_1015 [Chlamydia muridarum]
MGFLSKGLRPLPKMLAPKRLAILFLGPQYLAMFSPYFIP